MTTQDAAVKLERKERTVIRYIELGRIKATWKKVKGKRPRRDISEAALSKYLTTRKPVGYPPGRPRKKRK